MADSRRAARVSASLRSALAEVLTGKINDPRLRTAGLITVTGIDVSADLSIATVFVIASNTEPDALDAMLEGFTSAAPYLRGEVARRLTMKRTPQLRFRVDASIARGERIDTILKGIDEP